MSEMKPLAVLAGSGGLPRRVVSAVRQQGREIYIGRLEGDALPKNAAPFQSPSDIPSFSLSALGDLPKFCDWLSKHNVGEVCLVGGVRKPAVRELLQPRNIFILRRAARAAKVGKTRARMITMNDSALLNLARGYFVSRGIALVSPQDFLPDLLADAGALGQHAPSAADRADIAKGAQILQTLAAADLGQGVVVSAGLVLGVEAAPGTDALLAQIAALNEGGGVLVKGARPNQDMRLDLPSIGPQTIEAAARAGLKGVALEAGASLLLERERVVARADEAGLFVYGWSRSTL